jgi:hypothetical protein
MRRPHIELKMGRENRKKVFMGAVFIIIGFVFGLGVSVLAWMNPSQSPPLGGGVLQTDTSGLKIVTTTQITTGNFTVNNGNVGIGTTTPTYKLQVEGTFSLSDGSMMITSTDTLSTLYGLISTRSGGTAYTSPDLAGSGSGLVIAPLWNASGTIVLNSNFSSTAPTMFLNSTGNVGIGTTAPENQLSIESSSSIYALGIGQISGQENARRLLIGYDTINNYASILAVEENVAYRPLVLQQYGGNVGIGTTAPSASLEIARAGRTGILLNNTSDGIRVLIETPFVTGTGGIGTVTNHDFPIFTNSIDRITVKNNGNVGIGTTAPAYKLTVVGDIRTTGCLVYNGGTLGTCVSDIRLKDNITDLSFNNALAKVISLQPKQFTLKNDPSQKISGLIAQDVEQFAPELVVTDEKGYKQIKYGDVQWLLIEAIKEQQKEIEELKAQIQNSRH